MSDLLTPVLEFFSGDTWRTLAKVAAFIVVSFVVARMLASALARLAFKHFSAQTAMIARRIAWYGMLGFIVAETLHLLGVDLGVILGAAGILTVALGFASQTSASNVISGLFLLGERPFVLGDFIQVGSTTTGEVVSIDLLSVKLRTRDNLYVRVPNENLLKSEITNLTHYPIRRLDVMVNVAYKEDLGAVSEALLRLADANPLCLDEPRPKVFFLGFGESALNLQFSVWSAQANFFDLRDRLQTEIKRAFDEAGVEFPFPHRTLYVGSVTQPLPVRVLSDAPPEP